MRHASTYIDRSPQVTLIALACLLAGVTGASADLNDGLVGYWSFDEGERRHSARLLGTWESWNETWSVLVRRNIWECAVF